MEKIVKQSLLYDFYGELLTKHQRKIYEDAVFNDMSLSELSENYNITRQGAHDIIKRCDKALELYEDKLKLLEKTEAIREKAEDILKAASADGAKASLNNDKISKLAEEILDLIG
ncbi:MAG: DNA-binding protein [Lachnospiraceae bacterium]|nr:DNA-binding protein [Lachnospiraceae bacterium]